jgi:hypothetical protein
MPANSSSTHKDYILITGVTRQPTEAEIDLNAQSWRLPYSIDDSDLTFDGKPLNMLYEENRWKAEHQMSESRVKYSGHGDKLNVGRSRLELRTGLTEDRFQEEGVGRQTSRAVGEHASSWLVFPAGWINGFG